MTTQSCGIIVGVLRHRDRAPATITRSIVLVLLLVAAAIAAVAYPLLVYSLSLATFGLAHALVELRVLDVRYRRALRGGAASGVLLALAAVFVVRVAATLQWISRDVAHPLELAAGIIAVLVLIPRSLGRGPLHAALSIAVVIVLILGVLISPLTTLLVLAVLHNLAPWPLVAAVTEPSQRRRVWWIGAVVFIAVPLVIVTGIPFVLLGGAGAPEATLLPTGPLFDHFGAFWGPSAIDHPMLALHVFAACAYMQCAHYIGVLIVLPAHAPAAMRVPGRVVLGVVALGMVGIVLYATDFAAARSWYGTIAGVHAWAEFPALLLALDAFAPRRVTAG